MDTIVNYFTLLIVFVFDPLAIAMVIALNKYIELNSSPKKNQLPTPKPINKTPEPIEETTDDNSSVDNVITETEKESDTENQKTFYRETPKPTPQCGKIIY
jgi:hypothetical protein